MISLKDTTFIIPIRIDSADRAFNFSYVISYLTRHFDTNIFVWESDKKPIAQELLRRAVKNGARIKYHFDKCEDDIFHRTRLLNEMLAEVKTPVVVNYDSDVVLQLNAYVQSRDAITKEGFDLIYPYYIGESQRKVYRHKMTTDITEEIKHEEARSEYGHLQFFKTKAYVEGGMEQESFISYGPEDAERAYRFQTLGYKVKWLDNLVYHIEHSRGINSGRDNPHFDANVRLFEKIKKMTAAELRHYYNHEPYIKKYMTPHIKLVTYSDDKYRARQKKLCERAFELGCVDDAIEYTREALEEQTFYRENKALLDQPRGSGYWAWKPYIILETLKCMNENDIVVYLDSGDWISSDFRDFVTRKMRTHDIHLTDGSYPCQEWTKRDCFVKLGCDATRYHEAIQVEAGIIIAKKNPATIHLLEEWQRWCLDPDVISDSPNKNTHSLPNLPGFKEHRHDQSILSIMRVLHQISSSNEMRQYINCNQNE